MFKDVVIGDTVTRNMAGITMKLKVFAVTEEIIVCIGGWTFSRNNGAEIDEDLGWDEKRTGSFLVKE